MGCITTKGDKLISRKHKMVITIEIPLTVETIDEANEQMTMIMQADCKTFDNIHEMMRAYKGKMYVERKLIGK